MSDPEEHTQLTPSDDTIIRPPEVIDDTVISVDIDSTIVESIQVENTSLVSDSTVVESDDTVISSDDTVLPSNTTDAYGTLIGSLMDTSGSISLDEDVLVEEVSTPQQRPGVEAIKLRHTTGTKYSLESPIVFGRMPKAPRSATEHVQLVVLASPEGQVSSTHARVEQVGSLVVVTDLGSTNGTRIRIPGREERLLGPGDSLTLPVNATIDLGDGNRLEVLG